ncbi:hypothetical protein [Halorussus amylolyticus]|uniref:hypothetical protein n=1 Tax=Halorussus amylolyticus TaxID=1126242 RepID=UPI00104294C5|nr:hypothetical protein [Halorussus amylolyticus]
MAQTTTETTVGRTTVRNTWSSAAIAGLAGGLAFGILLQAMGMMPTIAALYGGESAAIGWLAHLFHSVVFGLVFAALVVRTDYRDTDARTLSLLGAGYGVVLWVVAAAIAMPLWLGALGLDAPAIPNLDVASLAGHLVYGVVLGAVFAAVRTRLYRREKAPAVE